jgi:hypothetical protein
MTSTRARIAPHVEAFFTGHLCHQKRVSPQTLASCRDTFRWVGGVAGTRLDQLQ